MSIPPTKPFPPGGTSSRTSWWQPLGSAGVSEGWQLRPRRTPGSPAGTVQLTRTSNGLWVERAPAGRSDQGSIGGHEIMDPMGARPGPGHHPGQNFPTSGGNDDFRPVRNPRHRCSSIQRSGRTDPWIRDRATCPRDGGKYSIFPAPGKLIHSDANPIAKHSLAAKTTNELARFT
jgi:hypothetical protein